MIKCPSCKHELDAHVDRCPYCGLCACATCSDPCAAMALDLIERGYGKDIAARLAGQLAYVRRVRRHGLQVSAAKR